MDNNNKEKICKTCGASNKDIKFPVNRLICAKCCNKQSNKKMKEQNYFKKYYEENKDEIKKRGIDYYNVNVKPTMEPKPMGRPKKQINVTF